MTAMYVSYNFFFFFSESQKFENLSRILEWSKFNNSTPIAPAWLLKQVQIVDTTCPWVSKVWNAVDNQAS